MTVYFNGRNNSVTRREALGAAALAFAPPAFGANRIDRSRVSAITDEIARTPKGAIEFARQYKLQWLELRSTPGERNSPGRKEYFLLPEAELKQAAREFRDAGIRISFLNTSMLKYWIPGTEPVNPRASKNPERFNRRMDELKRALDAAAILGTAKVRVFTGWRVADPERVMPRVADLLNEMAEVAGRHKTSLLIENEGACVVGNCAELVSLLRLVPSRWVGINWDPLNASHRKEVAFPDGYESLPVRRIGNVQIKGRSILPGPERMDWTAIFRRLERDGYRGQVGLETHIFGDIQVQKSHESIREILRIAGSPVS